MAIFTWQPANFELWAFGYGSCVFFTLDVQCFLYQSGCSKLRETQIKLAFEFGWNGNSLSFLPFGIDCHSPALMELELLYRRSGFCAYYNSRASGEFEVTGATRFCYDRMA